MALSESSIHIRTQNTQYSMLRSSSLHYNNIQRTVVYCTLYAKLVACICDKATCSMAVITHTVTIYEIKLTHIIGFVSASAFLHFFTHRIGDRLRDTQRVNLMSSKPVC